MQWITQPLSSRSSEDTLILNPFLKRNQCLPAERKGGQYKNYFGGISGTRTSPANIAGQQTEEAKQT